MLAQPSLLSVALMSYKDWWDGRDIHMIPSVQHVCAGLVVNLCGSETGIFRYDKVNTMAADALVTQEARSSAVMVLTM